MWSHGRDSTLAERGGCLRSHVFELHGMYVTPLRPDPDAHTMCCLMHLPCTVCVYGCVWSTVPCGSPSLAHSLVWLCLLTICRVSIVGTVTWFPDTHSLCGCACSPVHSMGIYGMLLLSARIRMHPYTLSCAVVLAYRVQYMYGMWGPPCLVGYHIPTLTCAVVLALIVHIMCVML